jgi:hypothetical protein
MVKGMDFRAFEFTHHPSPIAHHAVAPVTVMVWPTASGGISRFTGTGEYAV